MNTRQAMRTLESLSSREKRTVSAFSSSCPEAADTLFQSGSVRMVRTAIPACSQNTVR